MIPLSPLDYYLFCLEIALDQAYCLSDPPYQAVGRRAADIQCKIGLNAFKVHFWKTKTWMKMKRLNRINWKSKLFILKTELRIYLKNQVHFQHWGPSSMWFWPAIKCLKIRGRGQCLVQNALLSVQLSHHQGQHASTMESFKTSQSHSAFGCTALSKLH